MKQITRAMRHESRFSNCKGGHAVDNIKECISNLEDLKLLRDSISSFLSASYGDPLTMPGPCAMIESSETCDKKVTESLATWAG
jgi:hypothetical protein